MKILVIDVGGSHIKALATGHKVPVKIPSSPKLTAKAMVRSIRKAVAGWKYDAVSIGYPGIVRRGKPVAEPRNLGRGWVGFDFTKAFGCPVKVTNDAAMQALGSYRGGTMLFLGLGTGLGTALIVDGVLAPMEIAHLPYKKGRAYEEYVGDLPRHAECPPYNDWVKKRAGKPGRDDASDANVFAREMADVIPLPRDSRGRIKERLPVTLPVAETPRAGSLGDPDEPDDDFAAPGIDRREIRKLKRGEYPVAARRDLHGLKTTEAAASVRRFVDNSRHNGHRCVCIVHGRGLHSEGNASILKARVRECLRTHPAVLAYTNASRSDGGAGAVYVLLRK